MPYRVNLINELSHSIRGHHCADVRSSAGHVYNERPLPVRENESSDQMVLLDHGRRSVLYDEFTRFQNQNYDVSFYVSRALLSPDRRAVAYTLEATNDGRPFRLSYKGKPDVADSIRIARAAEALPVVEMLGLGGDARPPIPISRGSLVGWLSDTEVLLVKDGRLAVFDTHGKLRKDSEIRVSTPAAVFLR
jgi:hypothetical protein